MVFREIILKMWSGKGWRIYPNLNVLKAFLEQMDAILRTSIMVAILSAVTAVTTHSPIVILYLEEANACLYNVMYIYIYIHMGEGYVYVCIYICVCVCVCLRIHMQYVHISCLSTWDYSDAIWASMVACYNSITLPTKYIYIYPIQYIITLKEVRSSTVG